MKYIKILVYLLFGVLLVISSYIIIINVKHYNSLTTNTVVSEADNDYLKYKENVNEIEDFVNNHNSLDNKVYLSLSKAVDTLKRSGVYRLIPKMKLTVKDLYELNDYFMEDLINNNWVSNLISLDISNKYNETVMLLANNSKYLNSIFVNNSLILYDSKLDNKIEDNYHFILSNYLTYSKVLLNICNELGGVNG
jgi:hypothetical protein